MKERVTDASARGYVAIRTPRHATLRRVSGASGVQRRTDHISWQYQLLRESDIATEVELRLAVCANSLPALTRMLEARARSGAGNGYALLVSTYFDTPEHALAAQGLTLRVRERNGRFVQTVKSAVTDGGPLARGEWEDPIDGPSPDGWAPESGRLVPPEAVNRLAPLFRTEVERHTIALAAKGATRVEAAIDRGHVKAAASNAGVPVCEVELELKRGDVSALYDIALELLAIAPLRLEWRSKAERGYRLVSPGADQPKVVHAAAIGLERGLSGHQALQRIGRSCVEQILGNEAAVRAGVPEGVHQMRVGIRRLRAIMSAFAPMLRGDFRRWSADELRWLGGVLGEARNLDVFKESLIGPAQQALGEIPGIARLNAAVDERRAAAHAAAVDALDSMRYAGLALRLLRWLETRGWRGNVRPHPLDAAIGGIATGLLDERFDVARECGDGFASQSPQERHELRIALKKLRYAAELLGGLYDPVEVSRFVKRVKQLQDDLGEANDLHVGRDIVATLAQAHNGSGAIAGAGEAVLDWHEDRLAAPAAELRKHLHQLIETEPFWTH